MTLRDRLKELVCASAIAETGSQEEEICNIAIAAARVALEDATKVCVDMARHDYEMADMSKPGIEKLRRVAMGNRCDDCANDIRALREGLE